VMINQEEKRDLVLNLIDLVMINQEEKRDLVLNLMVPNIKIKKDLNNHLVLKNIVEEVEVDHLK